MKNVKLPFKIPRDAVNLCPQYVYSAIFARGLWFHSVVGFLSSTFPLSKQKESFARFEIYYLDLADGFFDVAPSPYCAEKPLSKRTSPLWIVFLFLLFFCFLSWTFPPLLFCQYACGRNTSKESIRVLCLAMSCYVFGATPCEFSIISCDLTTGRISFVNSS